MEWLWYAGGTALTMLVLVLLALKMELRKQWALPVAIAIPLPCVIAASRLVQVVPWLTPFLQISAALLLSLGISFFLLLVMFFRDPRRVPPDRPGSVVSPADGRILYIRALGDGQVPAAVKKGKHIPLVEFVGESLPQQGSVQIGIMMSYLDVHVNRAPIEGQIERVRRIAGGFRSLKHFESLLTNERVFTVIRNPSCRIGIVQIASRVVRRIVPFVREGDCLRQGDRIGLIRFGSQVDLFLLDREDWFITVRVGDYVKAGVSILATYGDRETRRPGR